mgnify:CR=1 FL=1
MLSPGTRALAGPFRIDRLVEFEGPFRAAEHLFPLATEPEVLDCATCHDPRFYDLERRLLVMAFHALLVRTPTHTILVDTCLGNDKPRPMVPEWNARSGRFIEVQGTAEGRPFSDAELASLMAAADKGIHELVALQKKALGDFEPKAG